MPITVYKSTDAGAPVFAPNVKGSLISVLDACLVNGYGSKSPLGWTKPFSGTRAGSTDPWDAAPLQAAAYQMPAGTTQDYMYIAEMKHAWYVQGYETMTSISHTTATGAFPRSSMLEDPTVHAGWAGTKADNTSVTTAIPWELYSNGAFIYFFYRPRSTSYMDTSYGGTHRAMFMFGDIKSYKTNDPYRCMCAGMGTWGTGHAIHMSTYGSHYGSSINTAQPLVVLSSYDSAPTTTGKYPMTIARGVDNAVGGVRLYTAINYGALNTHGRSNGCLGFGGEISYPNPADGGMMIEPIRLREYNATFGTHTLRGELPGTYVFNHRHGAIVPGTPFNGTGAFAGRTFELVGVPGYSSSPNTSYLAMVIETTSSGSWS